MLGLFTTSVLGFGSTPAPTTVTGYIADYACWNSGFAMDTGASMTMLADEHTVHCLKMSVCVNSGYLLVTKGEMDAENNPLKHAPHTVAALIGDWDRPYSREQGCFPPGAFRVDKYWPPVGRVDNAYGDRHLVCTCPPLEEYLDAAE